MLGQPQFSLGYLLLEVLLAATALGSFRAITVVPEEYAPFGILLLLVGLLALGAAIGGVFGKMAEGAVIALCLALIGGLLMPAVMTA